MRLYRLLIAAAIALVPLTTKAQDVATRCEHHTIKSGGIEREYYLYLPDNLEKGCPLVVALHGYTGSALKGKNGLMDQADKSGFAVCFPQGTIDGRGNAFWNVGYPFNKCEKVDDIAFIKHLVKHLQKTYGFNPGGTFMTGMSNGGEMCYLMAQKSPDTFRAIASVAGLTLDSMKPKYRKCVPFMEIHGTADRTSLWTGDPEDKGGWGSYYSVPASVSYLIAADKCRYEVVDSLPLRRNQVIKYSFTEGLPAHGNGPACEVWLYKVIGGKHTWAEADMDTFGEIWKFFSKYLEK